MRKRLLPIKPSKVRSYLKGPGKRIAARLADSPLPEFVFLSALVLSRWWLNSDFSYPSEILIPLLLMAFLASMAFFTYRFIFGPGLATHVSALLLSYVFYGYRFVHDHQLVKNVWGVIPDRFSTEFSQSILVLLLAALISGGVGWVVRTLVERYKVLRNFQPYKVLLFAVIFMFTVQLFSFINRYFEIREELKYEYKSALVSKEPVKDAAGKPDIYYLVFDRYGGADTIKQNFNYDNSGLTDYLREQGFVNRIPAYANFPFTMSSVSSTMAMSYFPDFEERFGGSGVWQAAFPYRSILNDPPIAQILRKNGYEYNQVSSWWDFTRINIKADAEPSKSFRLRAFGHNYYFSDLQRDIMYKSLLSPWLKKGVTIGDTVLIKYELDRHPRDNFYVQMEALKQLAEQTDGSPKFTFAHVLVPHPPYVFDADGSYPSYDGESTDSGADETVKYINQVKYLNKHIKELTSHIKQKSPKAVIVIQADEGPYPKEFRFELSPDHYYNPLDLKPEKMRQKFSILASYRMPGVAEEEVRQIDSSVNVFRFVLNRYLGYDLPMLPDCNLSIGNKFNIFNYELVNEELTGQPAPQECKKHE